MARGIGIAQVECGIKEPAEQYVEQFRFGLAEVVHEWAKGKVIRDNNVTCYRYIFLACVTQVVSYMYIYN